MFRQQQLYNLLSDRRILLAGYGREGKSTHEVLRHLLPNYEPDIAHNDDELFAALDRVQADNNPYDLIIKSPGIPTMKFEGRCNLDTITSQTDLFMQVFGDLTIGITGTKGKSTTTSLICHLLTHSLGQQRNIVLAGNIGIPLFDIISQLDPHSLVVAELSCHQLENIHQAPHIGVILNLFQEHLDHYHNYRDYQMAKMQMMLKQKAGDHCFYCTDSDDLARIVEELQPSVSSILHPYSLHEARRSSIADMPTPLQGDHNLCNTYVAYQVSALMGVDDHQFADTLASFHGLQHRLEKVGTYHNITFYNDSISTIPEATIAAVNTLQQVDTLILGGYDRGIDYSTLYTYLLSPAGTSIRNIVFVGDAGKRMHHEMSLLHPNPLDGKLTLLQNDYAVIVDWCFAHTRPETICLLSPAAASYDCFKNFEERGNTFKALVRNA